MFQKIRAHLAAVWATSEGRELVVTVALVILATVYVVHKHHTTPTQTISQPAANTTTVQVHDIDLTSKNVAKIGDLDNTAAVDALLQENKALKDRVTALTEVVATLRTSGGGKVTQVSRNSLPADLRPDATPIAVVTNPSSLLDTSTVTQFKDFRLDFVQDGTNARYELTQKFQIHTTIGRDKNGTPIARSSLLEVTPTGTVPATIDKVVLVQADETVPHWMKAPAIQAGLALAGGGGTVKGAVVSFQWLKHGRTKAAEDSTLSVLSPAIFIAGSPEVGILPLSINLGQIRHNPLHDIWVSPLITTTTGTSVQRVGIVIGSTF